MIKKRLLYGLLILSIIGQIHLLSGELKLFIEGKWFNLPYYKNTFMMNQFIFSQVYEPIANYTPEYSITYGIAKNWYVSPNWKYIEFKINTNRYFPDGSSVNIEDIKNNFKNFFNAPPLNSFRIIKKYILAEDFFKKVNDSTFRIYFKKPFPKIFNFFPIPMMRISKKSKDSPFLLGTGPYKLEKVKNNIIFLKKNKYYKEKPMFSDRILVVFNSNVRDIGKLAKKYDLLILMHRKEIFINGFKKNEIKLPILMFFALKTGNGLFKTYENRRNFYCSLKENRLLSQIDKLGYKFLRYKRIILPGLAGYGLKTSFPLKDEICKNYKKKPLKVKLNIPSPIFEKINFNSVFNENIKITKNKTKDFDVKFIVGGIATSIPFPIYLYDIFEENTEKYYGNWFVKELVNIYTETNNLQLSKKLIKFEKTINNKLAVIPVGASKYSFVDIFIKNNIEGFNKNAGALFIYEKLSKLKRKSSD